MGIEQVYGLGDTPQIQMLSMGFNKRNLYHFSRLDGMNPEADKRKSKRLGWYTTEWSRNFMLSMYKTAIENHWRKVNDPFLLKHEIPAFQIDKTEDRQDAVGPSGRQAGRPHLWRWDQLHHYERHGVHDQARANTI